MFLSFLSYIVTRHIWPANQAFGTPGLTLTLHKLRCQQKQIATESIVHSFVVHALCINANLPHVYNSITFERRLMTWIFAKEMSLWPTLVLLLNIGVTALCNDCLFATQPYFMEVTGCHMEGLFLLLLLLL